ncbi:MAG: hypothetical protein GDA43_10620 [Hormoscilla sp. SP5CHS1]|nr:hypothetical protein [Hormoscilla sp. SP5CHS1]
MSKREGGWEGIFLPTGFDHTPDFTPAKEVLTPAKKASAPAKVVLTPAKVVLTPAKELLIYLLVILFQVKAKPFSALE